MIQWNDILHRWKELSHLEHVIALLSWDQETYMPVKGAKARGEDISYLVGLWHERMCDSWWDEAFASMEGVSLEPDQRRALEVFHRDREREVKIPHDLTVALARVVSEAFGVWHEARTKSDYTVFLPALQKVFDLSLQKAAALGYERDRAYDAFLDIHEENLTQAEFDKIALQSLEIMRRVLGAIQNSGKKLRTDFLSRRYSVDGQKRVGEWVLSRIGFALERGRLDISPHPFSTTIAVDDVRLTTRYDEYDPMISLYGVLHEAGHGMYEQGLPAEWENTPLCQAISLGIHESQSRFWENQIGRSYAFVRWAFPFLREVFPQQLGDVSEREFFQAVNEVKPSLIRTEADEVTYGIHIIIRYEVEKKLFHGDISLADAREVWNSMYKEYLGISPSSDAEGILQDVHWSHGSFGYFPTYLLGNLYASQWYATMKRSLEVDKMVERGEFIPLLEWLREKIHREGRRYDAKTLVKRVSGEDLNPEYFALYLKSRYEEVYGILL